MECLHIVLIVFALYVLFGKKNGGLFSGMFGGSPAKLDPARFPGRQTAAGVRNSRVQIPQNTAARSRLTDNLLDGDLTRPLNATRTSSTIDSAMQNYGKKSPWMG